MIKMSDTNDGQEIDVFKNHNTMFTMFMCGCVSFYETPKGWLNY